MKSLREDIVKGPEIRPNSYEPKDRLQEERFVTESSSIPVRGKYDVIVVGGGTAGCVAALSAAKNGAKTLLVEKHDYLGGTLLGGAICFMGFFNIHKPYPDVERVQLIQGVPNEIVERLVKEGGSPGFYEEVSNIGYDSACVSWDRDKLPEVLEQMILEHGIDLVYNAEFEDTLMTGTTVKGILWKEKTGRFAAYGKQIVDCTGIAEVAAHSTAICGEIEERQTGGMSLGMANVDTERLRAYGEKMGAIRLMSYVMDGDKEDFIARFTLDLRKLPAFSNGEIGEFHFMDSPCMIANERGSFNMINAVTMHFRTTDSAERAKARVTLTKSCLKLADMLVKNVPGFENAVLDWVSPDIGIRFGRLVECEYDITREDLQGLVIPDDVVGCYGVQDAVLALGEECRIEGGWYGVPYRALVPKGAENLLVAGEMVTSDWLVWMSIRLTGGCMLMGQAAGTAAALAAAKGVSPRELDYSDLRKALLKDGAFLSNV